MMNNELQHHGTKGQKWGQRNYQNKDGSLTAAGRARYRKMKQTARRTAKAIKDVGKKHKAKKLQKDAEVILEKKKKELAKKKAKEEKKNKSGLPPVDSLSDAELQKMLNRLRNEESYQKYVNQRSADTGAKKFVKDYAKKHGETLLNEMTDAYIRKLVKEVTGVDPNTGKGKKKVLVKDDKNKDKDKDKK